MGSISSFNDMLVVSRTAHAANWQALRRVDLELDNVPSLVSLERRFAAATVGKAMGEDAIPGEAFRIAPSLRSRCVWRSPCSGKEAN